MADKTARLSALMLDFQARLAALETDVSRRIVIVDSVAGARDQVRQDLRRLENILHGRIDALTSLLRSVVVRRPRKSAKKSARRRRG